MLRIDGLSYSNAFINVHPAEKAVFALSLLLITLITKNEGVSISVFFVISAMIVIGAKIPLLYYAQLLLLPFAFLLSSVLVILLSIVPGGAEAAHSLWHLELWNLTWYITSTSLEQSMELATTVMTSVSCMYFLILTTPIHQLIWLLQKVKVPNLFIELMVFTYHFIFVLLRCSQQIYIAQVNRWGYRNYRAGMRSSGNLIVILFIKSMNGVKNFQIAMDSRGGENGLYEVEHHQKYKVINWFGMALLMITLIAINHFTIKL
jgi:cobalt/nickel transport system permease protein